MVRRIWKIVSTVIVLIVAAIAVSLVLARLFGGGAYAVLSGSMEPVYSTGSMIYTKKVAPGDLKVGDPVTFSMSEDMAATHRIVEIERDPEDPDNYRFITKGDANEENDAGYVDGRNVLGMPVFSVPYLGYIINFLQESRWGYYAVILIVIILLFDIIWSANKSSGGSKEPGKV